MAGAEDSSVRSRALRPLAAVGSKFAAVTVKPVLAVTVKPLAGAAAGAASAALDVGAGLERRAVDAVLDSAELERVLTVAVASPRVQAALSEAVAGELVRNLIADFVDGGAMDELVGRLLDSDAIWRLIDGVLDRIGDSEALWRLVDHLLARLAESAALGKFVDTLLDRLTESEALWRLVDEVASSPSVTAAITQQSLGFAEEVRDDVRTRSRRADDWLARVARRIGPRHEEAIADAPPAALAGASVPAVEVVDGPVAPVAGFAADGVNTAAAAGDAAQNGSAPPIVDSDPAGESS